jgi:putative RNA 2'-phosphotransferase
MPRLTRLSKFLSLILRHRTAEFNLMLDAEGFTDLDGVWRRVQGRFGTRFSEADLQAVVAGKTDGKKRFELREGRIRALYGHSRVGPVSYAPAEPPEFLYHGTAPQALASIRQHGLRSMRRQSVHLSAGREGAAAVGGRRTRTPVILRIRAAEAHRAGVAFHHPEPEHYLTKAVPAQLIDFPE